MRSSMFHPSRGHLAHLVLLASAATAAIISVGDASLSLSNFQLIADLSVPLGCLLAYNIPISSCDTSDFDSRRTCSAKCTLQHGTRTSTGRKPRRLPLRYHNPTNLIAGADHQVHHYGGTAPDHHRAATSAAAASPNGIFYFSRPTAATAALHNININTGPAPSSSSSATNINCSSTAGKYPRAARASATASASGNEHRYLCNNHDPDRISTPGYLYKAPG
ncbi:hypothetical protein LX36DRAFT_594212 [Colletotrichum falcatum]|nr:hypothetical protein LX36DRAFT_594212 [Colletotrichum falcatum]